MTALTTVPRNRLLVWLNIITRRRISTSSMLLAATTALRAMSAICASFRTRATWERPICQRSIRPRLWN